MILKNANIFKESEKFEIGSIGISEGKFNYNYNENDDLEIIDCDGLYMIPGLVDIHFHGCMGADMCDADINGIKTMAEYEAKEGITSICPATMTIAKDELLNVMETAGSYVNQVGSKLVGINMEGPFISKEKKGAQAEENIIKCDVNYFNELQNKARGLIKLVDIAPEEDGAMEFIDRLKDDVVISIAHTTADYEVTKEALERGASHITHLYNAMPPFTHRKPGVVGAARDDKKCHVEMICDGVHIHPSVIRATFEMFGYERIILISDSMRATGLTDGEYTLGGQKVNVKGNLATLDDGTLAGSVTNLMKCLKFVIKDAGIPMEKAIVCATKNPAKEIGVYDKCGSIENGKAADFVLLNKDFEVVHVYIDGKKIK